MKRLYCAASQAQQVTFSSLTDDNKEMTLKHLENNNKIPNTVNHWHMLKSTQLPKDKVRY